MKSYPLVEAVDDRPWVIKHGQGSVDPEKRVMLVPLGNSLGDRHVRAHEMAHVKITPRKAVNKQCKKFGVSVDALQVCEDLRVHSFLQYCEVPSSPVLDQAEVDAWLSRSDERTRASFLVASMFTADFDLGLNALKKVLPEPGLNDLLTKVHLVSRRLHGGKKIYRPIGLRNCTIPAAKLFDALWPEDGEGPGEGNVPIERLGGRELRGGRSGKWGSLSVQKISSSVMRAVTRFGRSRIFTDQGAILRAPYRMPIDGRVFVRKKRDIGGTVLIDASGSMGFTEDQLKAILLVAPAATIAIYSGRSKTGTLTVVAEKGKLAPMETIINARRNSGNSNVVDGPALQWLGKQSEPRLWISDGLVTGVGDDASTDLAAEAQILCRKGGIRRIEKTAAVPLFLRPKSIGR